MKGLFSILILFCTMLHLNAEVTLQYAATEVVKGAQTVYLPEYADKEKKEVAKWHKLSLNVHTATKSVVYNGGLELNFYRQPSIEASKVGVAKLKKGQSSLMLVFIKVKEAYKVFPIDNETFNFGTYYLVNLSSSALGLKFEKGKSLLKSGEEVNLIPTEPSSDIEIFVEREGKSQKILASRWKIRASQREVILFYNSSNGKNVKRKHILSLKKTEKRL